MIKEQLLHRKWNIHLHSQDTHIATGACAFKVSKFQIQSYNALVRKRGLISPQAMYCALLSPSGTWICNKGLQNPCGFTYGVAPLQGNTSGYHCRWTAPLGWRTYLHGPNRKWLLVQYSLSDQTPWWNRTLSGQLFVLLHPGSGRKNKSLELPFSTSQF